MAWAPTFSRPENRATRAQAWALHGVLVEQFIASHKTAPEELVLDIDASDVPLHGAQELSQFRAYCDHQCYLPLYVFCGQAMLACYLRPSRVDGARHAAALIKLLVTRLRQAWPTTRLIVRGDSGFCRRRLLQWCERAGVGYVIGPARNARLHAAVELAEASLADAYAGSGTKLRLIGEFSYAAKSWSRERRVITRLEYGALGTNPRFIVNQFRLLLAARACTLMQWLRALALQATEFERASAATTRVRLLRIGAAICATRATCASCSPATTRGASCSPLLQFAWHRSTHRPRPVLSPARRQTTGVREYCAPKAAQRSSSTSRAAPNHATAPSPPHQRHALGYR